MITVQLRDDESPFQNRQVSGFRKPAVSVLWGREQVESGSEHGLSTLPLPTNLRSQTLDKAPIGFQEVNFENCSHTDTH